MKARLESGLSLLLVYASTCKTLLYSWHIAVCYRKWPIARQLVFGTKQKLAWGHCSSQRGMGKSSLDHDSEYGWLWPSKETKEFKTWYLCSPGPGKVFSELSDSAEMCAGRKKACSLLLHQTSCLCQSQLQTLVHSLFSRATAVILSACKICHGNKAKPLKELFSTAVKLSSVSWLPLADLVLKS